LKTKSSDNPIIAAVERSLQGKRLVPVVDDWRSIPAGKLLVSVLITFDAKALKEVGAIVCLALLTGNRRILGIVEDALRESDHLFNRDREMKLARHVLTYLPQLWREHWRDIEAIKKEIEKRSNNGQPLQPYRWNRLRKALHLPGLPVGRRGILSTRRSKLCKG
jgi:hypothetical protein